MPAGCISSADTSASREEPFLSEAWRASPLASGCLLVLMVVVVLLLLLLLPC